MSQTLRVIAIVVFVVIPLLVLAVGQAGLLGGKQPTDLGLHNGQLKAPRADAWNSVSSQAALHPHTDYHVIAPLAYRGDAKAAFIKLTAIVRGMGGATVISAEPGYLYAQFQTPLMKYIDDVEFALDAQSGVIQMRSASRLGSKDFGANRKRLEAVRSAFAAQ
ncbi:MAG: DUF1499 domain-containing protein [Glaciimonas sp.]|nr:DUF1499 domain-containing protein [Glaciimonas sp.]